MNLSDDDYAIVVDATKKSEKEGKFRKMNINLNDSKNISYFRKYSKPDKYMIKGTSKNLLNKLNQFNAFHNDFKNYVNKCNNYDFYYFLRVSVYYGLDFCMNPNINKNNNQDNIIISFKLILAILDIIVDCLKYIESNLDEFIEFQNNIKNSDLKDFVLINNKCAIFSFFDDIHFLIKKIFGDSIQYLDWYIKFKEEINNFNPCAIDNPKQLLFPFYKVSQREENNNIEKRNNLMDQICSPEIYKNKLHIFNTLDKEISSCIIAYFTDYFSYIQGYKIIFRLIYSINTFTEENLNIQYSLIDDLFTAKAITDSFYNSHREEIQNLKKYGIYYIDKFNENNFDKINKLKLSQFCNKIFDLTEKDKEKKEILNENLDVSFILKQIQFSKKLEKKISFLSDLNKILKSIEYNDLYKKIKENKNPELNAEMLNQKEFEDRNKEIKIMDIEYFCKICQEKNIINIFLEDSTAHEEIIKRMAPLLKLMYSNNYGYSIDKKAKIEEITTKLFESLFKKLKEAEKNNENLWKIINRMILDDFTEILKNEDKNFVFKNIKEYLNESYKISSKINQIYSLIINYSLNCISKVKNEISFNRDINLDNYNDIIKFNFPEKEFYCLEILIQFNSDKNKINELKLNKTQKLELINICNNGIISILKAFNFNDKVLKIILTKIITIVSKSINTIQNIILFENIIELNSNNYNFRNYIKNLCLKTNLSNSLAKQFCQYCETLNVTNKFNSEVVDKNEELYDLKTNLVKKLNFIFVLLNEKNKITIDFKDLNNLFILSLKNELSKEILFSAIKENIYDLSYELRNDIYEKILLNQEIFKINDLMSFKIFQLFILELNKKKNNFIFITEKDFIVTINKDWKNGDIIYGFDNLWNILIKTENQEIQNNITEFLKDIILGTKFTSSNNYKEFYNIIIDKIINSLNSLIENSEAKNTSIKGLIILIKKLIDESMNDGDIIQDKALIDKILENCTKKNQKNNFNQTNNEELNNNNNKISIKACLELYEKSINDISNNIKKNKKNKKLPLEKVYCEIYREEFFYQLKYYISYAFKIPLKCIEIEIHKDSNKDKDSNKNEEILRLNIFDDLFNFIILFLDLNENLNKNNQKEESQITITVKKIENPLRIESNEEINNIKKLINSNKELQKILMNLLKNKNVDYTKDIWNMIKDKDNFQKENGIFEKFNELINNNNENQQLLNEICNFDDCSMFYKNFILSSLCKFLNNDKDKNEITKKFIKSNIWLIKIKKIIKEYNGEQKNKEKIRRQTVNELLEEKNTLYNLLNIYKIICKNIIDDKETLEFIINEIFNIYFNIIKECLYTDFNSYINENIDDEMNNINAIKIISVKILNDINELFKNNKNLAIIFLNKIELENEIDINDKNEFNEKLKFCFIDGILKNNYPFLNEKASQLIFSFFFEEKDKNDIRKKSYKIFSSIFFSDKSLEKENKIIKELFNNIDNNNKINIYEYNFKLYKKTIGKILYNIYKYSYNEFNYEKYILENVISYIYQPLLKDIKKENIIHDLYFGGQCEILYNYIQVMNYNDKIDKNIYNLIFNYNDINLKEYLFNEIIMYKCDQDVILIKDNLRKGKSVKIINSLNEANHLFISIIMKEIKDENNVLGNDLMHYLGKIDHFNRQGYRLGNQISDWKLNYREEVNLTSFIGLKNLGCTCYMNSLLQVLYHIIPFRESLLECNCKEEPKNCLYEVKKIFKNLKFMKDNFYYTPKSFVNNYDNEVLNVHQQMDVDEFFSNIIDKLENRLRNSENENLIKYFFHGKLNDALTFQEGCIHHRTNVIDFYSIQLQVQNKKNIYESLDALIEGELMNGDNCINCPQCNKKFPALKNQYFKTLPRMLIFVLKRFEFNYDLMKKIKINNYYEFPLELDMNKYTNEFIKYKNDKENNKYSLKSVIVHQGHSEGGHYYAFIKDNESQEWYKFNDTKVNKFDIKELGDETFGGKDNNSQKDKNKSAYLLFYEKIDDKNCESFDKIKAINTLLNKVNEDSEEFSVFGGDNIKNNNNEIKIDENSKEMINNINPEIFTNNLNKTLFSNEYHHLTLELYLNILNSMGFDNNALPIYFESFYMNRNDHPFQSDLFYLYRNIKPKGSNLSKYINNGRIKIFDYNIKNKKYSEEEKKEKIIELFKFILIDFFNIIIRSREKKYFGCYVDLIKFLIYSYDYCANYILEEFSCYNVIVEYLINCPLYDIKKIIVGIIYFAMEKSIQSFKPKDDANLKNNEKIKKEEKEIKNIKEKKRNKEEKEDNEEKEISYKLYNEIMNDPKYVKIKENDKIIKNIKKEINKKQDNNKKQENNKIQEKEKSKFLDEFEIIGEGKFEQFEKNDFNENESFPMTTHYIESIRNDQIDDKEKSILDENEGSMKSEAINKKDIQQKKLLDNKYISPNVIKLVNNIIYTMKKVKFLNRNEVRFLYALLLKFSIISDKTRNFLVNTMNVKLLLNIILFQKCRKKQYDSSDIINIDKGLFNTSHEILNSNKYENIFAEPDKSGKFIRLNYDYMLLCNLLYDKEMTKDEIKNNAQDLGFSFYNKDYIFEIIKYASTKQDINYLSHLLAKKCFNNKKIFEKILDVLIDILERIEDCEIAFYDKFEEEKNDAIYKNDNNNSYKLKRLRNNINIIFNKIIFEAKDEIYEYKKKNCINQLFSLFKKNSKYYGISISIINIIIDIYLEQDNALEKKQKILNEIKEWLIINRIPPKLYEIKGIKMYKEENMTNFYNFQKETRKEIIEQFDKEEIRKTNKKLEIINKILQEEKIEKDISNYNCDLSDFKFTIGDQVIYENKDYIITDCLDELIKIKLIEIDKQTQKELGIEAKGFHEKKLNISEKEKISKWIETDSYNLRIKKLLESKKKIV